MIITKKAVPRRTFLKGLQATLALPLLDAMIPAATALQASIHETLPARHGREVGPGSDCVEPLPVGHREVDLSVRVQSQPSKIESQAPVEDVVVREVAEVAEAVRARRLADARVSRGDKRPVERLARLANDEAQEALGLRRYTEVRTVSGAVLQAVGDEDLADDLPVRILHDPKTDLQFALVDVESDRCGSTQ